MKSPATPATVVMSLIALLLPVGAKGDSSLPASGPAPTEGITLPAVTVAETTASPASSTTLLDQEAFTASGKRDAGGVLRGQPGVTVLSTNRGAPTSLSLRGASSGLGQLTFDDVPLYAQFTGAYALAALPVDALEGVEMVRGASAPRYGSRALGGVVRLFSRDAKETGVFTRLEGGSFGTLLETAGASYAGNHGRITATASRDDVFEGTPQADPANGNREPDGFHSSQGVLRYAAEPVSNLALDGSLLYIRQRSDTDGIGVLPGGRLGAVDDKHAFLRGETWLAQNTAKLALGPAWDSSVKLGFTQNRAETSFHAFGLGLATDFTTHLLLARWKNSHRLAASQDQSPFLTVNWGGEARQEQGDGRISPFNTAVHGARGIVTAFSEVEAGIGPLSGIAGVHVDRYDDVGTHPAFYLGAGWQLTPELKLRANGGRGFRAPSFNERLTPFFGNPNLRPEQGSSGDIGIDWTPNAAMRWSLSGFYSRFDDLIQLSFVPQRGIFQSENIARTRIQGIEAAWSVTGKNGLSGGLDYTYSHSRNLDTGTDLPFRPQHQGRVWGEWQWSAFPLTLWAEGTYRGRHFDDNALTLAQGSAVRINAQASYQVTRQFSLYVRGENLNDNRTPEAFSFGVPGAAVYGGFRLQL